MTKYARDEFDRVPETSTRQGVHRAVTEARRRSLVPILSLGGIALVIGLVAFIFLPQLGFAPAGDTTQAASGSSASATPTPAGGGSETATSAPDAAEPTVTPSAPTDPASTDPAAGAVTEAAAVDKTQPVTVYNGTTTAGLASSVGATVANGGWVLGTLGNWPGVPQSTSVIFYSGPDQKSNAEALSDLLGIPTTAESAEFQVPLVVVLGPGFR